MTARLTTDAAIEAELLVDRWKRTEAGRRDIRADRLAAQRRDREASAR